MAEPLPILNFQGGRFGCFFVLFGCMPYFCPGFIKINPLKNILHYIILILLLSSCSAVKSAFQLKSGNENAVVRNNKTPFIEDITIDPSITPVKASNETSSQKGNANFFSTKSFANYASALESFSITNFKYAIRLDVPVENLLNTILYETIDHWWGTPYRMGGTTKKGIDCSAFVQTLILGAFAVQLPRTAYAQKSFSSWIPVADLKEGDLVFFNTRGGVSHVGVYLQNNKFVHSSTSKGVMISDLNDGYWSRKLIGAGRVLQTILPRP